MPMAEAEPTSTSGRSKVGLRRSLLAARRAMAPAELHDAGERFAEQVSRLEAYPPLGGTVAAYASRADEPATDPLLARLALDGMTVLLPALRPDFDLAWGAYPPERLTTDLRSTDLRLSVLGIAEPTGDLGAPATILDADLIVCPALAADRRGYRLGRGGGSYDRILTRYGRPESTCVLLYDDEILDELPVDSHDERIGWIVTPSQLIQITTPQATGPQVTSPQVTSPQVTGAEE
jgi:5-formyltetrahydrofolate cyclo-ligase